jgi:hypothetical protein
MWSAIRIRLQDDRGRRLAVAGLLALIAGSTLLHWLAGRRLDGLWILPDEGVYAARATSLWRHGSLPLVHGTGGGYGVLYPLVAGAPLSLGSVAHGYALLKIVQALVVSLAAVPVFVFGRRLMPDGYALVAAALTVASPLLLYSGLVMTEVLFYPVATGALLVIASAVRAATIRSQVLAFAAILVAALTRPQAVVFVAVFAAAIVLDAVFARDRSRLRSFWPTWLVLGAATIALAAFPSLVGSYADALRGSYPIGAGLRLSFEHLSFIALATGVVPFAAVALLTARAIGGLEQDAGARALLAVCACASVLLSLQVGFFAARYAPHLLGRDLAPLPPLFFLGFALWLARGAPRTARSGPLVAFVVLALVLVAPWNSLVVSNAFADTFDLLWIARIDGHAPVNVVLVFALLMAAVFVFLPRRVSLLSAVAVFALLISASAVAANELSRAVAGAQVVLGPDRSWIDATARGNVGYVYAGEQFWNVVWQERFWNRRLDRVYSIEPTAVPGAIEQTPVRVTSAGRLPIDEPYVVAADRLSFVGTPVAHLAQTGLDVSGLTLWKLTGPARLSTVENGVQPNGDMTSPAKITVYRCAGGRLELTLLPKATHVLRILLNGRLAVREEIDGLDSWHGTIPVPARQTRGNCTFTIIPAPLLGSTSISFVRSPDTD